MGATNMKVKFLEGAEGENSSKRLAGLTTSFVMLGISIIAAFHFIIDDKDAELLDLIETLCVFAAGLLTVGLADILMSKKYGKNLANTDSN